ncbi:MAG: 1-(5-phosphoribosyl)-5-[(5-phosphoribosylamino)methylideneamino]imidazole-4-carboxamide isomerase [Tissierellia bacterium]|jgi:phosphoribosylformimino-5-aminoimidazole carboxamide ribotide isomerase|nr:1-(5-phosphoribosyl)-5-[(5-phosphoribosylamino)methylideneamino]imidazole-4-carboxamide isomerase [Bacillota bacterium]NLK58071.1 1-(5-phosphoribosyl)-5-[(5-phosphoribosylamino)methylideneamino]imidazole-4-carboxamide isomerase [Tissierellia bacterium]
MILYPAIDLLDGKAVRLQKGDYDQVTVYHDDPVSLAIELEQKGAKRLHIVDLNGARSGVPQHGEILRDICEKTELFVQTGGGIRTPDTVKKLLLTGVDRIILGTAAIEAPDFLRACLQDYGDQIAVGIDVKNGKPAVRGWKEVADTDALDLAEDLVGRGVKTIIWTEISRDGMLQGTDTAGYQALTNRLRGKAVHLIASGGLTRAEEIGTLAKIGMGGAILGKAMYEGKLTLKEALQAAGEQL